MKIPSKNFSKSTKSNNLVSQLKIPDEIIKASNHDIKKMEEKVKEEFILEIEAEKKLSDL